MSAEADQSLLDRVEFPTIPEEVQGQIAHLQEAHMRAEVDHLRASVPLFANVFKKRNEIISHPKIKEDFWVRVFSAAPGEIDEYILPTDTAVLGEALKGLNVERFEVNEKGEGEPRSLRFTFDFHTGEENPYFKNSQLVKTFYWRKLITKTSSGKRRTWEGLVSDPVRINWKKDQDVTKGLLDATCDLFDAEKKKGGERSKLPEYEALVNKIEQLEAEAMAKGEEDEDEDDDEFTSPSGNSFFNWFGYRGRDVTAEQSKEATKLDEERWAKISKGEKVEDDEEEGDEDDEDYEELVDDLEEAEAFPDGEELAFALADDLWTDAMKYYIQSFELGDDLLDMDELHADMMEDDDEEEDEESHPRKKVRT